MGVVQLKKAVQTINGRPFLWRDRELNSGPSADGYESDAITVSEFSPG
jgi:hypothetical protein